MFIGISCTFPDLILNKVILGRKLALPLCLLFPLLCSAEQFVEVTAEVTIDNWDYLFLYDKDKVSTRDGNPGSLFPRTYARRCVVGASTWMMETPCDSFNRKVTHWFTGTNIIEYIVLTNETRARTNFPPVVEHYMYVYDSPDGNPDVADVMGPEDVPGKMCWLAFCSDRKSTRLNSSHL